LNGLDYTDDEIEKIINDIYGGSISREVLPVGLYNDIKARLNKAIFDGFGGTYSDFDTSTEAGLMMAGFEKNIAVFSGAKTFQQVNDMSNFLFTGTDKIPFGEFKKYATEIFETYNKNWLNTEYNTALSQASSARQWNDIKANEETFPLLKYITIGDERVRQQHKDLDEVVFAVGDKFWNDYFPPNDWNCRCTTEQLEEGEEPTTDPKRTFDPNPDLFKMNAGKDKIIFREDVHPYLKVDKRFEVALADNFGLPFKPEVKIVKPKRAK
jgi:SPP1 gp7 family putative phage head morphogenesis protein